MRKENLRLNGVEERTINLTLDESFLEHETDIAL